MENSQENEFCFQNLYKRAKLILNNSFFFIVINIFFISFIIVKKIEKEINIINSEKKSEIVDFKNKGFFEIKNKSKKNRKLDYNNKNKIDFISIVINKRNKGKNFLIRIINRLRNFIKIIKYIILLNLFNNIFVNNKISFIEYNSYNITLKIKGTGTKKIFTSFSNFPSNSYPDEVHINGYKQNEVTYSYYLNETDNVIGLIWYDLISSCNCMFDGCSDITEIDLFNFNTSQVIWMNYMFCGCSSLTSLNLSNFDTSKVKQINNMFDGCTNLEYINMLNFNESCLSRSSDYSDIFNNVPKNIVLCINKDNILNIIYNKIIDIMCRREDCSDDWKLNQKKIKYENNVGGIQCVDNCDKNSLFNFEYN